PQVAVIRSCVLPQLDRFFVLLDRLPVLLLEVIDYPQVVICVGVLAVALDGTLEALAGFVKALQFQLSDADFVQQGRAGLFLKSGTVIVKRVQVRLSPAQFIAALLQFLGSGTRQWRLRVPQRRTDLNLFGRNSLG